MEKIINHVLGFTPIFRLRRNHALEHATLQILSRKFPSKHMVGHSDFGGLSIIGNVSAEEVKAAANDALERLNKGEHTLAIHPNCGTNYAVGGMMAGLAGGLALVGVGPRVRDKVDRLSIAAVSGIVALIISQPIAYRLQEEITTCSNPQGLEIVEIRTVQREEITIHRIITRN